VDEAETGDIWRFRRASKEGLQANADAEEGLAGCNVLLDCWKETRGRQTQEAVTEVTNAW
jgi:hypothetical protein